MCGRVGGWKRVPADAGRELRTFQALVASSVIPPSSFLYDPAIPGRVPEEGGHTWPRFCGPARGSPSSSPSPLHPVICPWVPSIPITPPPCSPCPWGPSGPPHPSTPSSRSSSFSLKCSHSPRTPQSRGRPRRSRIGGLRPATRGRKSGPRARRTPRWVAVV